MNKTLYIVATPIGNLDDISQRAIDTLKRVNYVLAEDTNRTRILLDRFGIKTRMISLHKFNEYERLQKIKALFEEYDEIALVSDAGTPLISDPGAITVSYALDNQIRVVP
ncbi:MAG: SAM-dependent methyltransferase, partial [Pseudomonadota bacterium]